MSTFIKINVKGDSAGDVQDLLNRTIAANREELKLKLDAVGIKQTPEGVQEFARLTGVSLEEAVLALSPDSAVSQQAIIQAAARDGAKEKSSYRPDELSAQRNKQNAYPVAGFWLAQINTSTSSYVSIRCPDFSVEERFNESETTPLIADVTTTGDDFEGTRNYTYSNVRSATGNGSIFFYTYFPVSANTCVLTCVASAGGANAITEQSGEEQWSQFQYTTVDNQTLYYLNFSVTYSNNGFATSTVDSFQYQSYLIGKSFIKPIQTPDPFFTALESFYFQYHGGSSSFPTSSTTQTTFNSVPSGSPISFPSIFPLPRFLLGSASGSFTKTHSEVAGSIVSTDSGSITFTTISPAYTAVSQDPTLNYFTSSLEKIRRLGSKSSDLLTPGAFYAFNNPLEEIPPDTTAQAMKQLYFSDVSVPSKSLVNNSNDQFIKYDILQRLSYLGDELPSSPLSLNSKGRIRFNENDDYSDYLFSSTWDWGQSNYCRARLLEFGFTEDDLTP